jgi:hypothetical protein
MKCEVELLSRAKNGNPVPCGEPANMYRVSGEIASVDAILCDSHVNLMRSRGYRLELLPPLHEKRTAGTTTNVGREPGEINGA